LSRPMASTDPLIDEWRYERPFMYALQERAIFDPARYSVVEASTKSGKTVGCLAWIFEQAWMGPPGVNHWWVAPYFPVARIAYERLKGNLQPQLFRYNDTNSFITLRGNRSRIWFKSGEKPDGLYGEDVYSVVMDEATRMRQESWFAVRSTITATRAPVRVIGNVKGRKNWAYRMARSAQAGAIDYAYHKITAWDAVAAGVLAAEEIEAAQRDLPEDVFRELYLAEPTDDGANPFGLQAIAECVINPVLGAEPVVWGWDLARSMDYTVGVGLDEFGRVVAFHRWQKPWTETEDEIAEITGNKFALVDQTGVGDPVVEHLQRARKSGESQFEGFTFTSRSKQDIMESLARDIKHKDVAFPNGPIKSELDEFEFQHTRSGVMYSAPAGFHDDCVCALALAREALRNRHWRVVDGW